MKLRELKKYMSNFKRQSVNLNILSLHLKNEVTNHDLKLDDILKVYQKGESHTKNANFILVKVGERSSRASPVYKFLVGVSLGIISFFVVVICALFFFK